MICHGEMVRLQPDNQTLTEFYLFLSLGGVVGAVLVNIVAPFLFQDYYEFKIAILITLLLGSHIAIISIRRNTKLLRVFALSAITVVAVVFSPAFIALSEEVVIQELASYRNFYGVLKISELGSGTPAAHRKLHHDDIVHGLQLRDSKFRHIPNTYYCYVSGVGLTLIHHQKPQRQVATPEFRQLEYPPTLDSEKSAVIALFEY